MAETWPWQNHKDLRLLWGESCDECSSLEDFYKAVMWETQKKVAALDKVMYNNSLHVFESFRLITSPGQWLGFSTVLWAESGVTPRLQGGFARLCTCFSFSRRSCHFSDLSSRVPSSQAFTRCDWNLGSMLEDAEQGWWMRSFQWSNVKLNGFHDVSYVFHIFFRK